MDNDFSIQKEKLVDLTHNYSSETIYWPTEEGFELDTKFEGTVEKGYYYSAKKFSAPEHGGTHIDAPIHFSENGKTVDQIPLERLFGKAVVIDVSKDSLENRNYQVTVQDFTNWESAHGTIPEDAIILLHTGFGKYWPDRLKYLGTDKKGKQALGDLRFPGLDHVAAKWLTDNRKINAIGIDTQSIDYGKSEYFETHQVLCKKNIPFFENVANLDKLPSAGSFVIALPMKIKDGSGAPLRIIAINP